jgi:hypothetical protein
MSIEDYAQYVQEWLVEHQWQSLLGQTLIALIWHLPLVLGGFDFTTQYTYAYSKQELVYKPMDLGNRKIMLSLTGRQVYSIPAGRLMKCYG